MTDKKLAPAAYPAMLTYRLRYHPGVGRGLQVLGGRMALITTEDDIQRAAQTTPVITPTGSRQHPYVVVGDGPEIELEALSMELFTDWVAHKTKNAKQFTASEFDLLATVMARGDVNDTYGDLYWGRAREVFHILVCGIDWSQYYGVDDNQWSVWAGTFAEDTHYKSVLGVSLKCRCKANARASFGVEPPSLAQLMKVLDMRSLSKLFD